MKKIYPNIAEASYMPKLIRLGINFYGLFFPLMKLLPAISIITKAIKARLIKEGTCVIESSSGTFAKGLAIVCNLYKIPLIIVSDAAIDHAFKAQLEGLGARIEIVADTTGKGIQYARLERLEELRLAFPNHYWPCQYHNAWNREAYYEIGALLHDELKTIDFVVGPIGSGGSMSGLTTHLRQYNELLSAIAVDTHGSVLFGQADGKRALRGLGNSIMPANLLHQLFDEIHWVTNEEASSATRLLHKQHSIFAGPTSGASFMVASWVAKHNPGKVVVAVFPDEGWRYPDVFDNNGAKENDLFSKKPATVWSPSKADPFKWSRMKWKRMSYAAFLEDEKWRNELKEWLPSGLLC